MTGKGSRGIAKSPFSTWVSKEETDLLERLAHSTIIHLAFGKGIHLYAKNKVSNNPRSYSRSVYIPASLLPFPNPPFYTQQNFRFGKEGMGVNGRKC